MAHNFPSNPAVGDKVVTSKQLSYQWDGEKWAAFGGAFVPRLYVDANDDYLQRQIDELASNLIFVGSIDIVTDTGLYTAGSTIPTGPLPAASTLPLGRYVIVTTTGTPPAGSEIPQDTYAPADWIVTEPLGWKRLPMGGGGGAAVYVSETPPSSPLQDQLWWDSSTGVLAIYYQDVDTIQWVAVSGPAGPKGEMGPTGPTGPAGGGPPVDTLDTFVLEDGSGYLIQEI